MATSPTRGLAVLVVLAALAGTVMPGAVTSAHAHVSVVPAESGAGSMERYRLAVPGEKPIPTTRVEVQFPEGLRVAEIQSVAGWRATAQRNGAGDVIAAVWDGGQVPMGQFVELAVLARNPDGATDLAWKVIQTYQDGSEVHWIAAAGAEFPAATTRVRRGQGPSTTLIVALVALSISVVALMAATVAWRRSRR